MYIGVLTTCTMRGAFTLRDAPVQEQAQHATRDAAEEVEAHEGGIPEEVDDWRGYKVE